MKKYIIILLSMLYSVGVFGQVTAKHTESAQKYKIAVVPTIIIFKDGEEVARFQADLSFKMQATKEEVQEEIDNILMSDF
jgi:thioredoxin-like negative regulator of GroEL